MKVVVGNSLASVVAVLSSEDEVLWFTESDRLGGIWSGFQHQGRNFDYGFVNFEFDVKASPDNEKSPLYNVLGLNESAKFVEEIKRFVNSHTPTRSLPPVKIYSQGVYYSDFLLSDDLRDFSHFVGDENYLTQNEAILGNGLPHPSEKSSPSFRDFFETTTYDSYITELFQNRSVTKPFQVWGSRVAPNDYLQISALRHRSALLPLYYPETLEAALRGKIDMPATQFSYPVDGTISEFFNTLFSKATTKTAPLRLDLPENSKMLAEIVGKQYNARVIWGASIESFCRYVGVESAPIAAFRRQAIDILHFEVEAEDAEFDYSLLNLGSSDAWYRMTLSPNVSLGERRLLTLERIAQARPTDWTKFFQRFGLKNPVMVGKKQNVPAFSFVPAGSLIYVGEYFQNIHQSFPDVSFIGPSGYPFSNTMNDQIIQGLLQAV